MLEQQIYAASPAAVRALVSSRCWATLISPMITADGSVHGPVISHLPIIVDETDASAADASGPTILGHLARADADLHELGEWDVAVIVEGASGYVSPTLYEVGPYVPTWNFVVAHLYGRPAPLGADETFDVLTRTVEHLEAGFPRPWRLDSVDEYARSIAPYAVGFRLTPTRVVGKAKLSQDKPFDVVERVIAAFECRPHYRNLDLAAAMRDTSYKPGKGR